MQEQLSWAYVVGFGVKLEKQMTVGGSSISKFLLAGNFSKHTILPSRKSARSIYGRTQFVRKFVQHHDASTKTFGVKG
jgi:hypothetical protein